MVTVTPATSSSTTPDGGDLHGNAITGKTLTLRAQLDEVTATFRAHRKRLLGELSELRDKEWLGATRCHLWSVADVVSHLTDVSHWALAGFDAVASGADSSSLMRFDNRVTPHEYFEAGRGRLDKKIIEDLATGTDQLLSAVDGVRELSHPFMPWPIGHVSLTLALLHLLWDSWLHERDMFEPLNRPPAYSAKEVRLVASYTLLLAGLAVSYRTSGHQHFEVILDGPGGGHYQVGVGEQICVQVDVSEPAVDPVVRGPILTTIDALAGRGHVRDVLTGPDDAIRLLGLFASLMAPA
jgi:uncharacterized protein (TIGR03083 family)